MARRSLILILPLLFLLGASPALAQDAERLVAEARSHYQSGDFSQAATRLRQAKMTGGIDASAEELLELCDALSQADRHLDRRELAEAEEAIGEVRRLDPESPHLAKLEQRKRKYDDQLDEQGYLDGRTLRLRSRHFTVFHHHPYLAQEVSLAAESHLEELIPALGYPGGEEPRMRKLEIHIHKTRQEFQEAVEDPLSGMSAALATSPTEIHGFQQGMLRALRHEITHLVVHHYLPSMPVWVHEGLASGGFEQGDEAFYGRARSYFEAGDFKPADDFLAMRHLNPQEMPVFAYYNQARLLVEFLIHAGGGMEKFHRFCHTARDEMEEAIKEHARRRRGRTVIDPLVWIEKPLRHRLAVDYGYQDLTELDADLKRYLTHREKEAPLQARALGIVPQVRNFDYDELHRSKHFLLFTSCREKLALDLLELAEHLYQRFYAEFWDAGLLMPARVKIYLFDRQQEYLKFLGKVGLEKELKKGQFLLPHYSPKIGAACIFREGLSEDYLHQTLAHEVVHALTQGFKKATTNAGWVNEGIAHYVSVSVRDHRGERPSFGAIHETKLSRLASFLNDLARNKDLIPLAEFLELSAVQLNTVSHHVQSAGLFHFLQHAENGRYREGFHRYLETICREGRGGVAAFEAEIALLTEIEPKFQRYARRIERDSNQR